MRKDLLSLAFILILVNFILILINLNSIFVNLNMLSVAFVFTLITEHIIHTQHYKHLFSLFIPHFSSS